MLNLHSIKNIIFDLGGVLLNIALKSAYHSFKQLAGNEFEKHYEQLKNDNLFELLETGKISAGFFRNKIKKKIIKHVSDSEIDKAWNTALLDFPKENIELLQNLKKQYRTFLLSNTNEIHYEEFTKKLYINHGIKNLSFLFEKTYYSHILKMKKPAREIYDYVLNDSNLNPKETLFIDDTQANVETAQNLGISTYLLAKNELLETLFTFALRNKKS
jgi:putative hydrolase of the HAD superfamily